MGLEELHRHTARAEQGYETVRNVWLGSAIIAGGIVSEVPNAAVAEVGIASLTFAAVWDVGRRIIFRSLHNN